MIRFLSLSRWLRLPLTFSVGVISLSAAPVRFDIPAQPAPAALDLFVKQSHAQVVYLREDIAAVRANAVSGEMEPKVALDALLKNTGLVFSERSGDRFTVGVRKPGSIDGAVRDESGRPVANAKVTLTTTGQEILTDKRGRFKFADVAAGNQELVVSAEGLRPTRITDVVVKDGNRHTLGPITIPAQPSGVLQLETYTVSAKKNDGVIELDPYAVSGTKQKPFESGNMDIPRTINDAQPYYVFDAKTLDQSGATNIEDFLKQRLTMNTVAQSNGDVAGQNLRGNTSTVNLRGVGTDKTLILVNGRRMPGVTSGTLQHQADLNGIPLSAIDRIEVLPSSASGIYGGSAIGGVVNVILKRDYTGGEIRATYDNTWDTDAARRTLSASYGLALEGGRTRVNLSAAWSDAEPLLLQDRQDLIRRNVAIIQANAPTFFYSSTNPWQGSLPNITPSSAATTTLTLKSGGAIGSRNTYVPAGTTPTTSLTTLSAGLLANAGQWNFDFPATTSGSSGLLRPLGTAPKTEAFRVNVQRQMWSWVELFADFSYTSNATQGISNPFGAIITVPISAPNNPFTTAVRVRPPGAATVPITTASTNRSATLGATLQLPRGWAGAADYTWSENRFAYHYASIDTLAFNADVASGAFNPFVDTLHYPPDYQKYLQSLDYRGASQMHDFTARASGPLYALPWGTPTLTVGLEHRLAVTPERTFDQIFPITTASNYSTRYFERESATDSGYLEATVPLVKQARFHGVHALELQVAGRSERFRVDTGSVAAYSYPNEIPPVTFYEAPTLNGQPVFSKTTYTSDNFTVGFKYQPVKELTLRVSRASAFLPPLPDQLIKITVPTLYNNFVNDPKTGQTNVPVFMLLGGNPDLKPQTSRSTNAGIIWEPQWKPLAGLRLNAEYYRIEQFDAIFAPTEQSVVDQESLYPDRVVRNASGTITQVDISFRNLYRRETEGWDLSFDYTLQTGIGRFSLRATESIILHLKNQYAATLPAYEAAGYHPGEEGAAKYKTNAALTWEWRGWTAGWTTRYFSAYKQLGAIGGPYSMQFANGGPASAASYLTPQGSDTIPSQTYHDAFVGYAFGKRRTDTGSKRGAWRDHLLADLTLQIGVRNVFDQVPPLDVYYSSNFYLSPYGDTRLRSYWISVRKAF